MWNVTFCENLCPYSTPVIQMCAKRGKHIWLNNNSWLRVARHRITKHRQSEWRPLSSFTCGFRLVFNYCCMMEACSNNPISQLHVDIDHHDSDGICHGMPWRNMSTMPLRLHMRKWPECWSQWRVGLLMHCIELRHILRSRQHRLSCLRKRMWGNLRGQLAVLP